MFLKVLCLPWIYITVTMSSKDGRIAYKPLAMLWNCEVMQFKKWKS